MFIPTLTAGVLRMPDHTLVLLGRKRIDIHNILHILCSHFSCHISKCLYKFWNVRMRKWTVLRNKNKSAKWWGSLFPLEAYHTKNGSCFRKDLEPLFPQLEGPAWGTVENQYCTLTCLRNLSHSPTVHFCCCCSSWQRAWLMWERPWALTATAAPQKK